MKSKSRDEYLRIISFCILLAFSENSFSSQGTPIELNFSNVSSLIKSSKKGFEDYFLFVGKLNKEITIGEEIIKKDVSVEILANMAICYDEVKLSILLTKPFILSITNVSTVMSKKAKANKSYSWFLKIATKTSEKRARAACHLSIL